jgi:hypothetical protein
MTDIRKIIVMAIADGGRLDNRCGTAPSGDANPIPAVLGHRVAGCDGSRRFRRFRG